MNPLICQSRRRGFNLLELLVVLGIITLMISIFLPVLAVSREQARRVQCASNLRQFDMMLRIYCEQYKRYPSQRGGVAPLYLTISRYTPPNSEQVVGREFDGLLSWNGVPVVQRASVPLPSAARVLMCPNLEMMDPVPLNQPIAFVSGLLRETYWANGSGHQGQSGTASDSCYNYYLGYQYLGCAPFWPGPNNDMPPEPGLVPVFSPFTTSDPGDWTLAADNIVLVSSGGVQFSHPASGHLAPAGANHLFNDGHVEWILWDNRAGTSMMQYDSFFHHYVRRSMGAP